MKKKCDKEKCSYEWDSRVENPKVCPKCKQYLKKEEITINEC
jgi:predicted Zn-ribbon and HTH transcriptional regulator